MTHEHGPHLIPGTKLPKHCSHCGAALALKRIKEIEPERHVCTGCAEVNWLDPKVAVGVIVEYQGGLVMLERDIDPGRGLWAYPGGFVDRGETLEDAARREVQEEALVEIGALNFVGNFSYTGHPVILIAYSAPVISGTPGAGDEASGCQIWKPEEIRWEEIAFRSTTDALRTYLEQIRKAGS